MSKLKITKEHQDIIAPLIKAFIGINQDKLKEHGWALKLNPNVKDINKRFCFDVLNCIDRTAVNQFYDKVYQYADDKNVYSLLKLLIKPYFFTLNK